MQGDSDEMQGEQQFASPKNQQISIACSDPSLLLEQGGYPSWQGGELSVTRDWQSTAWINTMSEFIPSGYLSLHEALDRLGRDIFGAEWTGEERTARRGLISQDEWSRIKDLPPARGSGAPGSPRWSGSTGALAENSGSRDPSDLIYQAEYQASERYEAAAVNSAHCLRAGSLKQLFWIHLRGNYIKPQFHCGASTMQTV